MLNTFNRTYIGILQQANTDELAMHFKSVNSVFSITNSTGISTSLIRAERKIKERIVNDLCYYNTYLKRYPLRYETREGELENLVSLQECHLILMMDNLLRLITYSDPNPGENRTEQLDLELDDLDMIQHDTIEPETTETMFLEAETFDSADLPPLLCRHPPSATGRDDDIYKLKKIIDDIIVKTGRINVPHEGVDRILFGQDNKIGANLMEIVKDPKYNHFLPEFPLLYLRKSKINSLFSSYKETGLLQLLIYMCDEEKKEWPKLITMDHIDVATKYVRRLSLSFHISFNCRFLQCLKQEEALAIIDMLEEGKIEETSRLWSSKFQDFMNTGITQNCTFALHTDMMQHCDEVVAVYLSERLGGNTGYNLLLGAVKRSLPFSFLNGATSYGSYCAQLLIQHYSAGHFNQCLKKALYSTPIGNSLVNFACDSKREMDHQDAPRGFRSGSSMTSVISQSYKEDSNVDWALSETDLHHIIPTVALILRRNGLCLEENNYPENVYSSDKLILLPCVLDNTTSDIGKYLTKRYLANNSFLGMTMDDIPELNETSGPASFVRRELKCQQNLISLNLKSVLKHINDTVELVTIEFAGVKFKIKVTSGPQYIKYVQNAVIKPILRQFPKQKELYYVRKNIPLRQIPSRQLHTNREL
ncbi:unnamed protein product [Mytilus coruscus]|uniref:Uncharacterized protein n=1 Tax=Mytilus coruscus TaxID=42192 RepID=A0A6J8AES6_MYTCO|nr:unnamed protein product [Mytilus coruscus]